MRGQPSQNVLAAGDFAAYFNKYKDFTSSNCNQKVDTSIFCSVSSGVMNMNAHCMLSGGVTGAQEHF